jgi:hypothetical protein
MTKCPFVRLTADILSLMLTGQVTDKCDNKGLDQLFQAKDFLTEYFRNPQTVLAMFRHYGYEAPSASAVEKWFQRDSISGHFLPVLLCIAELEQGEPVRLARFMSRAG